MLEQHVVGLLEETHRLGVLPAAAFIGEPFPIGAQVVAIEHRGHSIHANAIDVELLKPEDEVGNKEVAHLVAAVIKDQRSPFLVFPDPGITVFVKVCAIKESQSMGVLREMTRNPVDDHADAFSVAAVHERSEFIGCSVAAGRGIPTRHLISPGTVEGVLRDRHHLDVGESPVLHIRNQSISELGVGEQPCPGLHVRRRDRLAWGSIGLDPGLVR